MENTQEGKTTAIVAYFTLLGALIAITMNMEPKHEFARFHTRQAFGLHIMFIAFGILSSSYGNAYSAMGLFLCYSILWGYGFIGALGNKKQSAPIVGPYFQKWFTFIQ